MGFTLRYAPHLGYLSPEEPLFRAAVGNNDPWDHVAFAADHGFAGLLHPWIASRPVEEAARFRAALSHFNMAAGCVVFGPIEAVLAPLFVRPERDAIDLHFDRSVPVALAMDAQMIAVLIRGDDGRDRDEQEAIAIDHLRRLADRVATAGLVIGIEPMIDLPGMLLTNTPDAVSFLDRVAHPAVKLIFDTGHVAKMDGDVLAAYRRARGHVGLLQLADAPGRVEPGAGTIDFAALLSETRGDGHGDGLIELEHGWSEATAACELAGIDKLRAIDARID